jgi:hypothetical protein
MIEDPTHRPSLRCSFCGESIEAQGNDPYEMLLTAHYCPPQTSYQAAPQVTAA